MDYIVKYTDNSKTPITIDEGKLDNTTAITLYGKTYSPYGKVLDEDILHMLENFACPEDPNNPGTPDTSQSNFTVFTNPLEGQFWYNSTQGIINFYNGTSWVAIESEDSLAANWGAILDGEYLPQPVNQITGKTFPYSECAYIVSPLSVPMIVDYLSSTVDSNGLVTSKYRLKGSDDLVANYSNYLIIGISGKSINL